MQHASSAIDDVQREISSSAEIKQDPGRSSRCDATSDLQMFPQVLCCRYQDMKNRFLTAHTHRSSEMSTERTDARRPFCDASDSGRGK